MDLWRALKISVFAASLAAFAGDEAYAVLFAAQDKGFTVDLPSAWIKVNPQDHEVLSLKRDAATIKIASVPECNSYDCIENETQKALEFVKSKKFRVLENTYSGEIIKRTEFSTGDPLLSFNYSGAAVDFTTAYFLADGRAYYVGIKGLPYVEADLILSFISPAAKPTAASAGAPAPRLFNEPAVEDIYGQDIAAPHAPEQQALPLEAEPIPARKPAGALTPFHVAALAAAGYFFLIALAFALRLVARGKAMPDAANPRSGYPVKGERLYGSPDLFFHLHDNQGNNYVANCSRWAGILMGMGLAGALFFLFLRFAADYAFTSGFVMAHAAVANTIISVSALLSLLGLLFFAAGFTLRLLFGVKVYIYDDKGALAFKAVQKGLHPLKEEYIIADGKSAVVMRLRRARFLPRRRWVLYNAGGEIAVIREKSFVKALLRMLLGHMCGFLRADYDVKGRIGSSGGLISRGHIFAYFRGDIDKPEAIPFAHFLAAAAVIYSRDRDKWHPWPN
ncbi:MAG: hypothetical protein LBG16_01575 [Elusimicrobiota bacterium]|jgi:hypothetical protein|nr:hypothetical protein [Elusimicrobiota bacterium]